MPDISRKFCDSDDISAVKGNKISEIKQWQTMNMAIAISRRLKSGGNFDQWTWWPSDRRMEAGSWSTAGLTCMIVALCWIILKDFARWTMKINEHRINYNISIIIIQNIIPIGYKKHRKICVLGMADIPREENRYITSYVTLYVTFYITFWFDWSISNAYYILYR